jgi:hypothetical protein
MQRRMARKKKPKLHLHRHDQSNAMGDIDQLKGFLEFMVVDMATAYYPAHR